MFRDLSPEARSRFAFAALAFSLYLIAADRTVTSGDPAPLYFFAPALAVFGTGHIVSREAFVRAVFCVVLVLLTSLIANAAQGRGLPNYRELGIFVTALSGLFALNLVIIVTASALLKRTWPASDHWTR